MFSKYCTTVLLWIEVMADAAPEDYLVNHSSITYLMGPDGKFVTLFPHDTKADFMAQAITKYLK